MNTTNTQNETKYNVDTIVQTDSLLFEAKENKNDFYNRLSMLNYLAGYKSISGFAFVGTKSKMREELNEIVDELIEEKINKTGQGFDTFVDAFGGAANSTLVLEELLRLSGIKRFILNDINKMVYHTHSHMKENPEELKKEFSELIRIKFYGKFETIFLQKEQIEEVFRELAKEAREMELNNEYTPKLSVYFIILREFRYSGNLEFYKDGTMKMFSKIYNEKKLYKWVLRQITRIDTISSIYNELNIEIYNKDYSEILEMEGVKNNPNALINLDPPYVKPTTNKYTYEELEKLKSSDVGDCKNDYNQLDFTHIELLEKLKDFNFIYNNNKHQIVKHYADKINAKCQVFFRNELILARKGGKTKTTSEYIVYNNSTIK